MKNKLYIVILLFIMFFMGDTLVGAVDIFNDGEGTIMYKYCYGDIYAKETPFNVIFNYDGKGIFVDFGDDVGYYGDGQKFELESLIIGSQGKNNCWVDEKNEIVEFAGNSYQHIVTCKKHHQDRSILQDDRCYSQIRPDTTESFSIDNGGPYDDFFSVGKYPGVVPHAFDGKGENYKISEPVYIIYEFEYEGQRIVAGEGFSETGIYTYLNHNIYGGNRITFDNFFKDFVAKFSNPTYDDMINSPSLDYDVIYLARSIFYTGHDFYEVDKYFTTNNLYLTGWCNSEDDCKEKYNYKVLASSIYRDNIDAAADKWYNDVGVDMAKMMEYIHYLKDHEQVNITSENLIESVRDYGVEYVFDDDYSAKKYLEDLKKVYTLLLAVHREKTEQNFMVDGEGNTKEFDAIEAGKKYIFDNVIGTDDFKSLNKNEFSGKFKDTKYLRGFFMDDAQDAITDKLKIEKDDDIYKYIIDKDQFKKDLDFFMQAAAYFNYMSQFTDLTNDEKQSLEELSDDLIELATKYKISPDLFSCSNLIGKELQEKINSYFNIVRISVPILLIGLGVMEYLKALFAQDDDSMKKAQKAFFVRIAISVLFFLTPTIVNLILKLANSIWLNINPDSCIQL